MISQLEIYHDDPAYSIKEKINELVDAINELTKLTEDLGLEAEQLEKRFDNHTHETISTFAGRPMTSSYPLVTMVDDSGPER